MSTVLTSYSKTPSQPLAAPAISTREPFSITLFRSFAHFASLVWWWVKYQYESTRSVLWTSVRLRYEGFAFAY
jgi:hypothetical protein